jgi:glycosyltransferase involved in cell wall biosynthesis
LESETDAEKRVSVIITCYNYGRFLGQAIESALAQTFEHTEVIVIDDGSTDETAAVARRYPDARYLYQRNQGESAARNAGAAEATGKFIVFLDADDELTPHAVETSLERLRENPDCAFAYGHQQFVDAEGSVLGPTGQRRAMFGTCLAEPDPYAYMLRMHYPLRAPGAILHRAETVERLGGFSRDFRTGADLDFNLRVSRQHPICCNNRIVLLTRLHGANATANARLMLEGAVRVQLRQREFVDNHPRYRQDYLHGLRRARSYWGGHLVQRITSDARSRKVVPVVRGLVTLCRFAPATAVTLGARGARRRFKKVLSGSAARVGDADGER